MGHNHQIPTPYAATVVLLVLTIHRGHATLMESQRGIPGGVAGLDVDGNLVITGNIFAKSSTGSEVDLAVKSFGGPSPVVHGYQARGSEGVPLAVQAGDLLFGIGSRPYQDSGYTEHSTGAIHCVARENFSTGYSGTSMRVLVTLTGGGQADRKEVVRFESDGLASGTRIRINGAGSLVERTYIQSKDAADISTSLGVLPVSNDSVAAGSVIAFINTALSKSGYIQI